MGGIVVGVCGVEENGEGGCEGGGVGGVGGGGDGGGGVVLVSYEEV